MAPTIQIGHEVKTGKPVELSLSLFERHAWCQGMTGSMKSILCAFIIEQILEKCPNATVLVDDLGGDQYSYHRTAGAAAKTGRTFKLLSCTPEHESSRFDPMRAITPLTPATLPRAASYLVTAWALDHGEGFGKAYYSRMNYAVQLRTLHELWAEGEFYPTLHDLAGRIAATAKRTRLSDISEAQLAAEQLLTYPQLEVGTDSRATIDPAESLERGDCIYGFFPTLMEPGSRMVAAMLAWSFVLEAMRRTYAGLPKRELYLIIDEFPSVAAGKQWADLITLARKYGISLLLISQTSSQFESRDRSLFPIVFDNTAIKIWLTPLGDDIEILRGLSQDILKPRGETKSYRGLSSSTSTSEVYEPMLEANEIRDTAFTGQEGFLIFNDFKGHKEPLRFRFTPPMSRDEHARLSNTPLPQRVEIPPKATSSRAASGRSSEAAAAGRQAALNALLVMKQAQENWQAP